MPENYSGRIALIVAVLLVSLAGIFSPVLEKLRHPHEADHQLHRAKAGH